MVSLSSLDRAAAWTSVSPTNPPPSTISPDEPYNPNWTAEEAWAHGYNPDGTPRRDDEWRNGRMKPFDPNWSAEEAWRNGFVPPAMSGFRFSLVSPSRRATCQHVVPLPPSPTQSPFLPRCHEGTRRMAVRGQIASGSRAAVGSRSVFLRAYVLLLSASVSCRRRVSIQSWQTLTDHAHARSSPCRAPNERLTLTRFCRCSGAWRSPRKKTFPFRMTLTSRTSPATTRVTPTILSLRRGSCHRSGRTR